MLGLETVGRRGLSGQLALASLLMRFIGCAGESGSHHEREGTGGGLLIQVSYKQLETFSQEVIIQRKEHSKEYPKAEADYLRKKTLDVGEPSPDPVGQGTAQPPRWRRCRLGCPRPDQFTATQWKLAGTCLLGANKVPRKAGWGAHRSNRNLPGGPLGSQLARP